MSNSIEQFIGEIKTRMVDHAQSTMEFPKSEPYDHGVQVGVYRGLQAALDVLDAILRDVENKEKHS